MSQTAKQKATGWIKGQIAPSQIKAIHAVINKLGLDDEAYRQMLQGRYNVASCKALTWRQAEELLSNLNGGKAENRINASTHPRIPASTHQRKYQDLDGRPGFASGAQCRLIDAMFSQVTRSDEESFEKALDSFCRRITGMAGLRMVKGWQVEKIVKALEAMGAVIKRGGA